MGNTYSTPQTNNNSAPPKTLKEFYDVILAVDDITTIDSGWPLKVPNQNVKNALFATTVSGQYEWKYQIMAVHGQYNRGKTFLLNLLTGSKLPSGKTVSTVGLSFKEMKLPETDQNIILLDTAGLHTPVSPKPNETLTDALARRKATEYFLRDVAISVADIHIVIVNDFSDTDQEIILSLCHAIQLKKAQDKRTSEIIFVIHNFKDDNAESAKRQWEKYVVSAYGTASKTKEMKEVSVLFQEETPDSNGHPIEVRHMYLCNNDTEKAHNEKVAKLLLSSLTGGRNSDINRSVHPREIIQAACQRSIKSYVQLVDKLSYDQISDHFKLFFVNSTIVADTEDSKELLMERLEKYELNFVSVKGNNQFEAVHKALDSDKWKTDQLRIAAEKWLLEGKSLQMKNGVDLKTLQSNSSLSWEAYVHHLCASQGDVTTLVALANVLGKSIYVVSGLSEINFVLKVDPLNQTQESIILTHWGTCQYGTVKEKTFKDKTVSDTELQTHVMDTHQWVLRAEPKDKVDSIKLKDYQLNASMGVQFDLSDTFTVKYTEVKLQGKLRLFLDLPGFKPCYQHDEQNRRILLISGERAHGYDPSQVLQNTRKFGKIDFKYLVPEGYIPEPKQAVMFEGQYVLDFQEGKVDSKKVEAQTVTSLD